jgi:hypothetical protein
MKNKFVLWFMNKLLNKTTRFMYSCKEGDFIVVECVKDGTHRVGSKMIICYGGRFVENADGPKWHSASAKFLINMGNNFRIDTSFGIDTTAFIARKPTIKEYMTLVREVKKHGLVYNKKRKELCPIMTL